MQMLLVANLPQIIFSYSVVLFFFFFFCRIYDLGAYSHVFAVLKSLKYFAQVVPVHNNKTDGRL